MGRLIDADFILNKMETTEAQPVTYSERYAWGFAKALLNNAPTVEAIPKAEYENRLKADLVAILTELQLEIEEMDPGCGWEGYRPTAQIIGAIQQKINALKG